MTDLENNALPQSQGHEAHRVNVRAMAWFVVGFVACGLMMNVALWWFMGVWARESDRDQSDAQQVAHFRGGGRVPALQPSPEHGALPFQDLEKLREQQERRLSGYGHDDEGFAHIPIARAMQLVLEKKILTTRPGSSTQPFVQTEVGQ